MTSQTSTAAVARSMREVASLPEAVVKVSVIVPVYNPGRYLEDCIASLLGQDMPAGEFEAIFVDDGSTDDSPRRLDALAAAHPHMRVIHQENSGWSGRPRNVGIEASRGEYVFFVDNDDSLGDQALRRMYEFAKANDSDIVVGKMVGKGRGVPRELFRKTYPSATLANSPLIDSLTPHKLFRKAFLDKHDIRFPEGKRRLEDHVFVTAAYFAAETISVLSDYVCYYHIRRDDRANAGFGRIEPKAYFGYLREALDIVDANTEPGPLRDRLYRRWYRVEMLGRLRGKRLLNTPAGERVSLLAEIRQIVDERFGPGVAAALPPTLRIVGSLAQAGRLDDLLRFARWETDITAEARLEELSWHSGALHVVLAATLCSFNDRLTFVHHDDRDILDLHRPLSPVGHDALAQDDVDCTARLSQSKVDLVVRNRTSAAEYLLPTSFSRIRQPVANDNKVFVQVLQGEAAVDIATAASGSPLPTGTWDLLVRITSCGWTKETRLSSDRSSATTDHCLPAVLGDPARVASPYWTDKGDLALDVGNHTNRLGKAQIMHDLPRISYGDSALDLHITIPLTAVVGQQLSGGAIRLRQDQNALATSVTLPATLTPAAAGDTAGSLISAHYHGELDPGRWSVEIRLTDTANGTFVRLPTTIMAPPDGGRPVVEALVKPTRTPPTVRRYTSARGDLWRSSMRAGRRFARRMYYWMRSQ